MRLQRLGFELRMELAADEMWMVRQFNHLDIRSVRRGTGNSQSCRGQLLFVFAVELVTMPMSLADLSLTIDPMRQRSRLNFADPCAQAHSPAEFLYTAQLAQLVDHAVWSCRIEFARVGFRQPANIA